MKFVLKIRGCSTVFKNCLLILHIPSSTPNHCRAIKSEFFAPNCRIETKKRRIFIENYLARFNSEKRGFRPRIIHLQSNTWLVSIRCSSIRAAILSIIFSYDRSIVNTRPSNVSFILFPVFTRGSFHQDSPIRRERAFKKNGNGSFGSRTRRRAARFVFVQLILVKSRLQNKPCDTVYIGLGR